MPDRLATPSDAGGPCVRDALRAAQAALARSSTPRLDAELLVAHVLGLSRPQVLARSSDPWPAEHAARLSELVARRADGEPVAYLVGRAWFHGLELEVTPDVLVPRPETEALVAWAGDWLRARPAAPHRPWRVIDVGTGSGAIALALADRVDAAEAEIWATDVSPAALAVARRNAARLGVGARVRLSVADLLPEGADAPAAFDVVVANLPYVGLRELGDVERDVVRWEPHGALFAGPDGLDIVRRLLAQLPSRLAPDGAAALEIGWRQGPAVRSLAAAAVPDAVVTVHPDLAGLDRMVVVQRCRA
ncbi:peptide chain release factor N(5)-glutamine methyltransferase [bacterium]|nr:MAG: peptide chain release factor N(5)-glutamine methyltransferase [bacterium]